MIRRIKHWIKKRLRPFFVMAMRTAFRWPWLKRKINNRLQCHPRLFKHFKGIIYDAELIIRKNIDLAFLTVSAQHIYNDLKSAIEQKSMKGN